ncbi:MULTISPECIES: ABC transporter ATP-binding protein [Flavobacterium]|uniref:ABC transporter ATP-binding protein n=1 Tax=Flavobacterium TaxID=237 RepID=UPI001FCB189F|nr:MULTISPECIES: polysaccharide ABC transporter ATP-binding protein [Flavobacterium]UOK43775.1 polysaccharide ABC transporter ATP-binding protein [Flavobacterium enshiense]
MSKVVIKAEDISKQYRLGLVGTGTVKDDMKRWWYNLRGKEDPFLKIGEANNRAVKGVSDYVWSLRDINFEINKGDSVGIIGRNGAGKSTLLKILSQVTQPTTGKIYTKGRIASLLEVGTGFHPEMTGRENIFLNGAILGMRKHEIQRKLDEIIAFSGVERYIDTPVKRYSSGMYVRLAFAVAAHLESEILIVDEVLAVGDAEFQKKCLGKMNDVSKGEGRTVLFVSHNMAAVKSLCRKGIVLKNGGMFYEGLSDNAVSKYLAGESENLNHKNFGDDFNCEQFYIKEISINPKGLTSEENLDEYHEIEFRTSVEIKANAERLHLTYVLKNCNGEALFTFSTSGLASLKEGGNKLVCSFPKGFLNIGNYYLDLYIIEDAKRTVFHEADIMAFTIQEGPRPLGGWMGKEPGFIKPIFDWVNI